MTLVDFSIRILIAFILGAAIGFERQWQKTRTILKTNVLVSLGASMFVMMAMMVPGENSPTRVAAQVVSGIGFLGGGVILREGTSVRGLNTAATLWCSAAIGALTGYGLLDKAYLGALVVVVANFLLKPLFPILQEPQSKNQEPLILSDDPDIIYQFCLTCSIDRETTVRTLLLELCKEKEIIFNSISSRKKKNIDEDNNELKIEIQAELLTCKRQDFILEELAIELKKSFDLSETSWKILE
jgi:putative Mg2+ transporter-C (MgtC) family protein